MSTMSQPRRLAQAYAQAIGFKPDELGHYVHPVYGRSDLILKRLIELVGKDEALKLINQAVKNVNDYTSKRQPDHPDDWFDDWFKHYKGERI